MRTHVILPEDLVEAVDAQAGKGKRSQFIEEAIREKLRIDALHARSKQRREPFQQAIILIGTPLKKWLHGLEIRGARAMSA